MVSTFGDWLVEQIRQRGWETLREAGDALGIDHSSLSRYARGEIAPSRRNLRRIAVVFGACRDDLEAMIEADKGQASRARRGFPDTLRVAAADPTLVLQTLHVTASLSPKALAEIADIIREDAERRLAEEQRSGG
jgi:transcriptional regulator with XRE-family HTH domain